MKRGAFAAAALAAGAGPLALTLRAARAQAPPSPSPAPPLLRIATTFSFSPLVNEIAAAYRSANPSAVAPAVRETIYRDALRSVENGDAEIAIVDRPPDNDKDIDHRLAVLPFAVVAAEDAPKSLSKAQVGGIFGGSIRDWSAAGGARGAIVPIVRAAGSGTTALFASIFGPPAAPEALVVDNTSSAVADAVRQTRGAIGYLGLPYASRLEGVRVVALDGVLPSAEAIAAGKYPFFAYLHAITAGVPPVTVSRFLSYFETRRELLHARGYYTVFETRRT